MERLTVLAVVLLFAGDAACSQCRIDIGEPSPLFVKKFGSQKFSFRATTNNMYFDKCLTAYCSSKISSNCIDELEKSVDLCCAGNQILYAKHGEKTLRNIHKTNCDIRCDSNSASFSLFESSEPLPNCNSNTYGIGFEMANGRDVVVAGVCYDIVKLSLKYASYVTYEPSTYEAVVMYEIETNTTRDNMLNVDLHKQINDLDYYFSFMSPKDFDASLKIIQSDEPLLLPFAFDFDSLLQDKSLPAALSDFRYIFNTIWWRQLRLGNWRLFLHALAERAQDVSYMVHTGTHGRISIPAIESNCKKNTTLAVGPLDARVHAPAYTWSYIKSLKTDIAEEFVVIAHNSPYVEEPSSHTFCTDMCDEIEWLKNSDFGRMRQKTMLGYAFCCRPAEVAAIIDNFPVNGTNVLVPTTTPIMPTSQSAESNSNFV